MSDLSTTPASANPHRGEVGLLLDGVAHVLRPTFAALVAAEEELGPLFTLVERASGGELKLGRWSRCSGTAWRTPPTRTARPLPRR